MIVQLVGVIALLVILWYVKNAYETAGPAKLARYMKPAGGLVCLALSLYFFTRGHTEIALAVAGFGLYQMGIVKTHRLGALFGGGAETASHMRSALIEMVVERSGAMSGTVLAGPYMGRNLDDLPQDVCMSLWRLCRSEDPFGAQLLEAYLDRRFTGWRPAGEDDADARRMSRVPGAVTEDEAYEILGLAKGATREDIARAHRALMKKLHPDHGGTTALAARVNEAKSVLMRKHG